LVLAPSRAVWGVLLFVLALAAQAQDRTLSVSARESSDQRLALVIGNSAYKVGPLRNPANDARAMASALRASGFEVMHGENLSHRRLFEMTRDFGRKLRPGVVALFYYAGHGLQVRDRNFLIPVEADPQSEEEVPYTSVDVNFLLDVMNRAKSRVNIVILDACRNNPFARSFRSGSGGLAQMDAPSGTLIAYATAPGRVASDGGGDHGLYTQHLLKHLNTPGLPVEILFKRVREGVERETKSQQIPWESSSLKGDFYFTAAAPAAPVAAPIAPPPPPAATAPAGPDPALLTELAFWDAIKTSSVAADYLAYLETYPKGRFASLARARVNSLKVAAAKPAPVLAPVPAPVAAPAPQRPAPVAAVAPTPVASGKLPAIGERYVYRYTDLWKPSRKVDLIHSVSAIRPHEIIETISTAINGRTFISDAASARGAEIREWNVGDIAIREFSPFAVAFGVLQPGAQFTDVKGVPAGGNNLAEWAVRGKVAGEEDVTVPAGRFRATKVVLVGSRDLQPMTPGTGRFELTVWYAPELKRHVKLTFDSFVRPRGSWNYTDASSRDVYELVSAPR
jgi:hypothetical protein